MIIVCDRLTGSITKVINVTSVTPQFHLTSYGYGEGIEVPSGTRVRT